MNFETPRRTVEHHAQMITRDSEAYKKVQPLLAMRLYRDDYFKDAPFDTDPRHNSRDKRHEAIDMWEKSLSDLFDQYIRANPTLEVDLSAPSDVEDLYQDFKRWLDEKRGTIGDLNRKGVLD